MNARLERDHDWTEWRTPIPSRYRPPSLRLLCSPGTAAPVFRRFVAGRAVARGRFLKCERQDR